MGLFMDIVVPNKNVATVGKIVVQGNPQIENDDDTGEPLENDQTRLLTPICATKTRPARMYPPNKTPAIL